MTDTHQQDYAKKWYQEFWAWFILSPLIVVVIVSSFTVTVAVRGADDRVVENYYKEGRMINVRLDEDIRARELGVQVDVLFDHELNEIVVSLSKTPLATTDSASINNPPSSLLVELLHPSTEEKDRILTLSLIAGEQYQAELDEVVLMERYYLRISSQYQNVALEKWRLRGEVQFPAYNEPRRPTTLITLTADD